MITIITELQEQSKVRASCSYKHVWVDIKYSLVQCHPLWVAILEHRRECMTHSLLASHIDCFLHAGSIRLLSASGKQLITKNYHISPTEAVTESQWARPVRGSLAALCGSCPPGSVTALPFQAESRRAVVILADHTLTVVSIDQTSTEITQVCIMVQCM